MSTFDGVIQEFPYIQSELEFSFIQKTIVTEEIVDYFRKNPDRPPPLVGFLSHVHSDHLQGLESFRAPFIYCSAATRELLLRIEKYPHRMNFSRGILESRRLHYKHLAKLLRPIPLATPTEIELTPRLSIRVTLLDANHCTGAVMFLIEGNGKSILYTGDIRAESWWVSSLVRHPILIPYTLSGKRLDKIYLDTTFARHASVYRIFPSKAEGLAELLQKVASYPEDTTFYFRAWTFGYEEVWMALSAALNSKVHVDRYQMGLYKSLVSSRNNVGEASALCGFELGNKFASGCLSEDEECRIHSCEPGVQCSAVLSRPPIYIIPIVSRAKDGSEVPEIGAGGGGGDLYQLHELEIPNEAALEQLEKLCLEKIQDSRALSETRQALVDAFKSKSKALSLDNYGLKDGQDIPLESLVNILSRGPSCEKYWSENIQGETVPRDNLRDRLPRIIHFPYSRHSSYAELCELVSAFKPKDVYPCTVDPLTWDEDVSMQSLFGHLCTGTEFTHDQHMRNMLANDEELRSRKQARYENYSQQSSQKSFSMFNSGPRVIINTTTPIPTNNITSTRVPECPKSQSGATSPQLHSGHLDTHHKRRRTFSSPRSSSDRIPLPSSLETIQGNDHPQDERITIPESTQNTEQAKRNMIREAWHFLNNAYFGQDTFHLGSLPSSWPTDEEDGFIPSKQQRNITPRKETTRPALEQPDELNMNVDVTDRHIDEPDPNLDSQHSHNLSISSSAFTSQEQPLELSSDLGFDGTLDDYVEVHEHPEAAPISTDAQTLNSRIRCPHQASVENSSSRLRRAAYIAARTDSYEAWASLGLVSAGDNHTEEEIEL
ncbi:DNA crosslink repair [Aspergillus hancockii]|nr:DNA crosslink repair [Aspergillus hancockii]